MGIAKVSRKSIKQRLGFPQIRCIEALNEPVVGGREEFAGIGAPALLGPQSGKARRGAEFPKLCTLLAGDTQSIDEASFGRGLIPA
jgi:hypothetical protein